MNNFIFIKNNSFKILIILSFLFVVSSCNNGKEPQEESEIIMPVKAFQVGSDQAAIGKNFPARTRPRREVNLAFRVSGPLMKLDAEEGQYVTKGSLIAKVDDRDLRIDLDAKKADYEFAKVELERYERLLKKQSIAENEYDTKVAAFRVKEALYADAQNAMEDASIYAPFTGYVGEVLVENYEEVRANQPIVTLLDLSDIEIQFYVPESMLFDKEDIEGFEVFVENYPGRVFKARLKEIGKIALAEGFPVTIVLDTKIPEKEGNINVGNAAGFTVRVNILFKDSSMSDKVVIPVTALMEPEPENNIVVWVLDRATMTVKKRKIEIGNFTSQTTVEVTDGVENGEWVITAGLHRLKDGQKVKDLPEKL